MFAGVFKDARVLITGHTGFKGSWLAEWLLQLGANVAGYSLDVPTYPSNSDILHHGLRLMAKQGDILDLEKFRKFVSEFQPEIIFHLAAQSLVRPSYDDPKYTFDVNLGGTVNVMEVIRTNPNIRVGIFVSTDKCYRNNGWEWGYRENDALGGDDPYSASKACMELAFHSYFQSFFSRSKSQLLSSVRAGNVIGGGDWATDRIVPDCVRGWSRRGVVQVRAPHSIRPWQHVLEPLSGYLQLAATLYTEAKSNNPTEFYHGESFNFGPASSESRSVSELVRAIQVYWGKQARCSFLGKGESHKKEHGLLKLTCEKAMERLQWKSTLSFSETAELTSIWYKKYYSGKVDMVKFTQNQIRYFSQLAKERKVAWAVQRRIRSE